MVQLTKSCNKLNRHIDISIVYQPLLHHLSATRGSQTANEKPEQNRPINIIQNQPIDKPEVQLIRRSLRLRIRNDIKAHHTKQSRIANMWFLLPITKYSAENCEYIVSFNAVRFTSYNF